MTENFWSHGTPLGYLGAGSQEALGLGACRFQILVIWGPYDFPVLVVCQGQAKNLKTAGARCEPVTFRAKRSRDPKDTKTASLLC